jgi:cytochrome c
MLNGDRSNGRDSLRITPAIALAGLLAAPALAQDADLVAHGEKVFKRCAVCHKIGDGAANAAGPSLEGVIGRTAGTGEGFAYSDAMVEAGAGGLVWNDETLSEYLTNPKAMVKGTKMVFAGLKSEDDRSAVIAYIEANGG